eukprot:scaffold59394_cov27-Tisochrysis_lutea.AAC.1
MTKLQGGTMYNGTMRDLLLACDKQATKHDNNMAAVTLNFKLQGAKESKTWCTDRGHLASAQCTIPAPLGRKENRKVLVPLCNVDYK